MARNARIDRLAKELKAADATLNLREARRRAKALLIETPQSQLPKEQRTVGESDWLCGVDSNAVRTAVVDYQSRIATAKWPRTGVSGRARFGALNAVITGGPGSGRSTAARLLGESLREASPDSETRVVDFDEEWWHFKEVGIEGASFPAGAGGVLILESVHQNAHGLAHLDNLLNCPEPDPRVVIMTGYDTAVDALFTTFPELTKHFVHRIKLPQPTARELAAATARAAHSRPSYRNLSTSDLHELEIAYQTLIDNTVVDHPRQLAMPHFRDARNIVEWASKRHARSLVGKPLDTLPLEALQCGLSSLLEEVRSFDRYSR